MTTWNIDQGHSIIGFKVKHLVVSTVRGAFEQFEGSLESADDSFENARVTFTAQAASITTHNATRDEHLRSADFFDVTEFPTITFTSTSFTKDGDTFAVVGDLTMHGITKEVTFTAHSEGIAVDMHGKRMVAFEIQGSLQRSDFGLMWNHVLETGGVAVSDEVRFDMQIEAVEA